VIVHTMRAQTDVRPEKSACKIIHNLSRQAS
jgi:hypothetical protein